MTHDLSLATKYRPTTLEEVLGQDHIVSSLRGVLEKGTSRSFLFTGQSGAGKTTLARIVATSFGCAPGNVTELDAATNNGIDDIRSIIDSIQFCGLGSSPMRVVIIDEAHALSKAAITALLKALEEPPKHVVWCLCTTDAFKIPETIKNRCVRYDLKPVSANRIHDLLLWVAAQEGMELSDEIIALVAQKAEGSPRRALTGLAMVQSCTDRAQAATLLRAVEESAEPVLLLCRDLARGATWSQLMSRVRSLEDVSTEGVRQEVLRYFTAAALDSSDENKAGVALAVMDAFSFPYNPNDGVAPIVLAIGRLKLPS